MCKIVTLEPQSTSHWDRPPYGQLLDNYDVHYPSGHHDPIRVCARLNPKTGKICGTRYRQWSHLQDNEPWSDCERCERMWNPWYKKNKKKK